jgi:hypothetical protein
VARASAVEACIFCERLPCECNGPVQRKPRSRKVVEVAAPVLEAPGPEMRVGEDRPSARDKMRAAVDRVRQLPPPSASKTRARRSEADLILASAIRALEPILHPDERVRFASIITSDPSLDERLAFWKARHKEITQ